MLTSLQVRLARIVRALPEADGFALAGAVEELAANKVLALYDRAEARDFLDVMALTRELRSREGFPMCGDPTAVESQTC